MAVNKPQLGGQNQVERAQRTNITTPTVPNNQATDIVKNIGNIINNIGSIQARRKEEQNKEDVALYLQKAQEDAINIQTALETGNSVIPEFNDYVNEQRQLGVTDTEINRELYNMAYATASEQIGDEVFEADKAYLQSMSLSATKSDLAYAKKDMALVLEDKKDLIYSTSNMTTPDENYQDRFNDNIIIGNQYNIDDNEIINLTIQRAFDLADRGDETMMEELQNLTYKGTRIIDTVAGAQQYNKLRNQHENKLYQDEQRSAVEKERKQVENTTSLYTSLVTGTPNYAKMKTNIDDSLIRGDITKSQHTGLLKFVQGSTEVTTYSKHSDAEIYSQLRGKAQLGTLPIDELLAYKDKLTEAHFKSIADLAISQGGIEGKGSVIGEAIEARIREDGKAIGNISILEDPQASLFDKGKARSKSAYATFQLNKKIHDFASSNGRHPDDNEYERILNTVRADADKQFVATEFDEPVVVNETLPVKQLRAQYLSFKTKEERKEFYKSLTPKQRELLKGK